MKSFYFIVGIDHICKTTFKKTYKKTSCTVSAENINLAKIKLANAIQKSQKNIYIDRFWELKTHYETNFLGIQNLF